MPISKIKSYLERAGVSYMTLDYADAYTAQEVAAATHISGSQMVKTVMLKVDDALLMVVVPANKRVDLDRVREATGADRVTLADEADFGSLFKGCEVGAMPPLGHLYGVDMLVDTGLAGQDKIAFRAGTHDELVRMGYEDFARLAKPRVTELTER
jgi:Ala-tRNA(Pro) deacylase